MKQEILTAKGSVDLTTLQMWRKNGKLFKEFWQLLKIAFSGFSQHRVPKLSSSLSFYTIFSLGPMMLVILFVSGLFWGQRAIEGTIHDQISGIVGDAAGNQIEQLIKNASIDKNDFTAVISFILLIFAATTVFTQIQDSMNIIWNLKVKKQTSMWRQMLKTRLLSFSIITGLGLLLFVFLIVNGIFEGFMTKIQDIFPEISIVVIYVFNLFLTLLVVVVLFAVIFKVLPDAVIRWKDVAVGAFFTAVLFMIGKFLITFYMNKSNPGSTFGSAGSLVVLLLWIFYSSNILYFGAEFTKAYAVKYGGEIKPNDYAVTIKILEVESNKKSIQQNEKSPDPKRK